MSTLGILISIFNLLNIFYNTVSLRLWITVLPLGFYLSNLLNNRSLKSIFLYK